MAATHRTSTAQQQLQHLRQQQHQQNQTNNNNHLSLHQLAATHRFAPYPLHQPHLAASHAAAAVHHPLFKINALADFYPQQPLTNKSSSRRSQENVQQQQNQQPIIPVASSSSSSSSSNSNTLYDSIAGANMFPVGHVVKQNRIVTPGPGNSNVRYNYPGLTANEILQMENYIRNRRSSPPALVVANPYASHQFHPHSHHILSHHHHLHQQQQQQHSESNQQQQRTILEDGDTDLLLASEEEELEAQDQGTHISHLFPEILTEIFSKLSVRDRGRAAQVCTAWRDATYLKCVWRGEEAKLHLRRATPVIFNSLVRRGIRKVQVLSLRRTLKDVVFGLPQLESLNLSGCYNVTDLNLGHSFSADLPNLKVLDLSLCKQITDTSLSRIAQHLKNLEVLELGGCSNITNTGLLLIAWGLKKLRRLNLRSCWHISDQGIGHLAGLSKETAEGNQQLEYLGLQDCQRLSDEALKHVSEGLPSLRSINLSFCVSVTDSGLKYLSRMPLLEELNLRACDNVSDIGMSYLAADSHRGPQSTHIRALDVSFCDKIGDQALLAISHGLFHLRSLSLSACTITDEGLERISKSLQELETLNVGQCGRLTDVGILALAEHAVNLKAIDLYGCTKITTVGLNKVMMLPKLASLNLGLWHRRT